MLNKKRLFLCLLIGFPSFPNEMFLSNTHHYILKREYCKYALTGKSVFLILEYLFRLYLMFLCIAFFIIFSKYFILFFLLFDISFCFLFTHILIRSFYNSAIPLPSISIHTKNFLTNNLLFFPFLFLLEQ